MGYIRHHAIIVTTFSEEMARETHDKACEVFGSVNLPPIIYSNVNGYSTIFIPPDGSKEGWPPSDLGDFNRAKFLDWVISKRYEDGSSSLSWAEIQYGDDEDMNYITSHSGEVSK